MNIEILIIGLTAASALTSLVTEAVKNLLNETSVTYKSNILAAIVSIIVTVGLCAGYIVYTGLALTAPLIVAIIAMIILSWVGAMVGYDKVIQTIKQLATTTTTEVIAEAVEALTVDAELDDLTVAALKEYAESRNINIEGLSKKADIIAAIQAASEE